MGVKSAPKSWLWISAGGLVWTAIPRGGPAGLKKRPSLVARLGRPPQDRQGAWHQGRHPRSSNSAATPAALLSPRSTKSVAGSFSTPVLSQTIREPFGRGFEGADALGWRLGLRNLAIEEAEKEAFTWHSVFICCCSVVFLYPQPHNPRNFPVCKRF